MSDAGDDDQAVGLVDGIDDAIITDPYPVVVLTREMDGTGWPRIPGKIVECERDPAEQRIAEASIRPHGRRMEAQLIRLSVARAYRRTSAQLSLVSRSSRACSAARLSSRYSTRSISSA